MEKEIPIRLQVVPSFGVLAPATAPNPIGDDVDLPRLLHVEQHLRFHQPLPTRGSITTVGTITDVFDKGKAAVIYSHCDSRLPNGELLFETDAVIYYLGGGGFGGSRGPKSEATVPPVGVDPDFRVTCTIPENQACLYRLNGDLNPLHIDPAEASRVGFPRPILHGLCTYGYATRAIVRALCEGDTRRFRAFGARFSEAVFPGDTLTTEGWRVDDGRYRVQVRTERGAVMTNSFAEVAQPRTDESQ